MQTRSSFGLIFMILLLAEAAIGDDAEHPLSLWQVDGQENRIYLLGSIHLLREKDHPLPTALYDAYRDAEVLFMELDMDDMDPVEGQVLSNELGLIQDGRTLAELMGAELYAKAESLAADAQIPLTMLKDAEPWYAAMNIEIMLLMRMGFSHSYGIENHMMEMAKADSKEIYGLETIRQQLGFLDGLSARSQREMLIQALVEGMAMQQMMDSMIDAWRMGDVQFLEDTLLSDMRNYPELNRVIVVERNKDWSNQIEELLDDSIDYLIIVGALHLIGDDGVPDLLTARGHNVTQLQQSND